MQWWAVEGTTTDAVGVGVDVVEAPGYAKSARCSVASWFYGVTLYHEHHGLLISPCPVSDPPWDREALPWHKLESLVLKVEEKFPTHNIEEFILIIMVMPVKFPFKYPKSDERFVHFGKSVVHPFLLCCFHIVVYVDYFEMSVFCFHGDHLVFGGGVWMSGRSMG